MRIVEAACWAHARRKFFDLARLNKAPIAIETVARIDALLAIERDIDGLPPADRRQVRRERSRPRVEALGVQLPARRIRSMPGDDTSVELQDLGLQGSQRCGLRPGNVHSADGWKNVLEPVVARYRERGLRRYFRADAAFANPEVYEFLEAEGYKYTIRLPANRILQERIGYLLKRPVGRPPITARRYYASFSYQAQSWTMPRRVVAKVEWHPGELYPRVGFIVTNMSRPAERVVAFYNKRGTCEQWIKEGKGAIKWTRLSCRTFVANAVRLQLHALAYNLGNFLRTLATPEPIKDWSLTSLKEKLIKIGAKVVSHGRYVAFQMAEVAIPRQLFQEILRLIAQLQPQPPPVPA
jgi:hypothetical protein